MRLPTLRSIINHGGSLSQLATMSQGEVEAVMGGAAQARNAKMLYEFLHASGPPGGRWASRS